MTTASNKMDTVGFSELASSSLPTLGAQNVTPSWKRSLHELKAASESLLGRGQEVLPTTGARVLLGGRHPSQLSRLAASVEQEAKPQTPFLSVEELLQRHQTSILDRIHRQVLDDTRRNSQELREKQLQEAWEKEKERWIKDLVGTRTLGGSSAEPLSKGRDIPRTMSVATTRLDAPMVQAHLEIIKRLNREQLGSSDELSKEMLKASNTTPSFQSAYSDAWKLLFAMLLRPNTSVESAVGAMVHFSNQFRIVITNRTRAAALDGQDASAAMTFKSRLANSVASFVKLELGIETSLWPQFYYCLRCGDVSAAKEVLECAETSQSGTFEATVHRVVSSLSQVQSTASNIWEMGPPMLHHQDRQAMVDLYERSKHLDPSNIYRIGSLALLSGADLLPSSDKTPGFNLIEDYLYGSISKAIQDTNMERALVELGGVIRGYGPSYFDAENSQGWAYTLPLLATQQYRTALSYLAGAGGATGLLQAAHIGIVLKLAEVEVDDLGHEASSEPIYTSLIVAYAAKLHEEQPFGAAAALEYLVRIPDRPRVREEVAALITRSSDIENLTGGLSSEGERQRGVLDDHLAPSEVSSSLTIAAEKLLKEADTRTKAGTAGRLFLLAGRFDSVLFMLSRLMSPPYDLNENRQFWVREAEGFHKMYLSRRSHVLATLEQENRLNSIEVNRTMISLCYFFDKLQANAFEEALSIIDNLNLLPRTKNELSSKEKFYDELDPLVKQSIPTVLKGAMESLYHQYRLVRSESHRNINTPLEQRLQEIRERGRLLVMFAGLLSGVSAEVKDNMTRLEAHMI